MPCGLVLALPDYLGTSMSGTFFLAELQDQATTKSGLEICGYFAKGYSRYRRFRPLATDVPYFA